eukprot:15662-Heterococcus_DN1.PRE.1
MLLTLALQSALRYYSLQDWDSAFGLGSALMRDAEALQLPLPSAGATPSAAAQALRTQAARLRELEEQAAELRHSRDSAAAGARAALLQCVCSFPQVLLRVSAHSSALAMYTLHCTAHCKQAAQAAAGASSGEDARRGGAAASRVQSEEHAKAIATMREQHDLALQQVIQEKDAEYHKAAETHKKQLNDVQLELLNNRQVRATTVVAVNKHFVVQLVCIINSTNYELLCTSSAATATAIATPYAVLRAMLTHYYTVPRCCCVYWGAQHMINTEAQWRRRVEDVEQRERAEVARTKEHFEGLLARAKSETAAALEGLGSAVAAGAAAGNLDAYTNSSSGGGEGGGSGSGTLQLAAGEGDKIRSLALLLEESRKEARWLRDRSSESERVIEVSYSTSSGTATTVYIPCVMIVCVQK